MPESMRDSLDILASKILTTKSGISSKYPRMTQSGGFSSYTMLSSDENVGQLLGLFVLLHTTEGRKIMEPRFNRNFDQLRKDRSNNIRGGVMTQVLFKQNIPQSCMKQKTLRTHLLQKNTMGRLSNQKGLNMFWKSTI